MLATFNVHPSNKKLAPGWITWIDLRVLFCSSPFSVVEIVKLSVEIKSFDIFYY